MTASRLSDMVLTAIRDADEEGLSLREIRSEIRRIVGASAPIGDIEAVLRYLAARDRVHLRVIETAGRPAERWCPGPARRWTLPDDEEGS